MVITKMTEEYEIINMKCPICGEKIEVKKIPNSAKFTCKSCKYTYGGTRNGE